MKFAVSLMRLLCAMVAGAVLVAFLFFSANYEQTGLTANHTAATVSMILLIGAIVIWAIVTIIGDLWLKNAESQSFYDKLSGTVPLSGGKNNIDGKKIDTFIKQINSANTDYRQSLNNIMEKLNGLLEIEKNDDVKEKINKLELNMAQLQTAITQLQTAVEQQLQTSSPQTVTTRQTVYPQLKEEANYPESVIDYTENEHNDNQDIAVEDADASYTDEPLEHFLEVENKTDVITTEIPTLNKEETGTTEDLPDVVTGTLDLDADDPFGAAITSARQEPVFAPEHHTIDLGADNPFGTSVDAKMDISAIEPTTQAKKNEPNLDKIFNDKLASELADLEILNGKPTEKTQGDIDLEQFFAGHRKSLDN